MVEQYYTGTITFRLKIFCSSLKKKKSRPGGVDPSGGLTAKSNISANSNLYSKWLLGMKQGVGGRVLKKKTDEKSPF
jgi:hypothetical protein